MQASNQLISSCKQLLGIFLLNKYCFFAFFLVIYVQVLKLNTTKADNQELSCNFIMELRHLKEYAETFRCKGSESMPNCDWSTVDLEVTSIDGLIFRLQSVCKNPDCKRTTKQNNVSAKFDQAFQTAMVVNGISPTQMGDFLLDLNFTTSRSESRRQAVDICSVKNVKLRKSIKEKLVEVGHTDQQRLMEAILKAKPEVVFGMIDGAYPTRGHSSRVAFVTLMVMWDGKPQVLFTVIVKKKKVKSSEEQEDSEAELEGDSIWTEVSSNGLEGECHIL